MYDEGLLACHWTSLDFYYDAMQYNSNSNNMNNTFKMNYIFY